MGIRRWSIAHIYFLLGVHARLKVAVNWLWIDRRNEGSARLITSGDPSRMRARNSAVEFESCAHAVLYALRSGGLVRGRHHQA